MNEQPQPQPVTERNPATIVRAANGAPSDILSIWDAPLLPGWCRVVQNQQQRLLTSHIAATQGATPRCF